MPRALSSARLGDRELWLHACIQWVARKTESAEFAESLGIFGLILFPTSGNGSLLRPASPVPPSPPRQSKCVGAGALRGLLVVALPPCSFLSNPLWFLALHFLPFLPRVCVCSRLRPLLRLCWRACHRPPVAPNCHDALRGVVLGIRAGTFCEACPVHLESMGVQRDVAVGRETVWWREYSRDGHSMNIKLCDHEAIMASDCSILIVHVQDNLSHDQHSRPHETLVAWCMLCRTTCFWHTIAHIQIIAQVIVQQHSHACIHAHMMSLERRQIATMAAGETATQCAGPLQ